MIEERQYIIALGVIQNNEGKILVTQRHDPKSPYSHLKWQYPGGSIEFAEEPRNALIREIQEEVGITIEPVGDKPFVYSHLYKEQNVHIIAIAYPAMYKSGTIDITGDPETGDYAWLTADEIAQKDCLPLVKQMTEDSLKIFNSI
jgi:8-oxo-dGTP diphosphatase